MTPRQSPVRNGIVIDSRRVGLRLFAIETVFSAGPSATSLGLGHFKRTRLMGEGDWSASGRRKIPARSFHRWPHAPQMKNLLVEISSASATCVERHFG